MNSERKKILIITGRYLPGYKDGGPVRTIKNLVDHLGKEYEFYILTCDRDHGDEKPYPDIKREEFNLVGNANVYYVAPKKFTFSIITKLSNWVDLVYICGCFNDYAIKTLILKRIGKISKPVVVASMGLFSSKSFKAKYMKKKLFVEIFNIFGMFKNIYWSATSEREVEEIKTQIKVKEGQFFIAEDLPRRVERKVILKEKKVGELNVIWISRIAPIKNLLGVIEILKHVKSKINFTIYGFIHDEEYWKECQQALEGLPENIRWVYEGSVDSEAVIDTFSKHHIFIFTTFGENYGHVIQEALSAGCPCVLSNQTPWIDLEKFGIGKVYELNELESYVNAIEAYAAMDGKEFQVVCQKAVDYAIEKSNKQVKNTGYKKIFKLGRGR